MIFTTNYHRSGHMIFMLGMFILLIGVTVFIPLNNGITKAFGVSDITRLSNQARDQLNREPLSINTKLMNAAQYKAEDMTKQKYFAHISPDGTEAWDYFKKVDYTYEIAGENLAITNESADSVINGWLDSPTHRDNLLNNKYKDFGIGMSFYGDYQGHKNTYIIVAFYGVQDSQQDPGAATLPAGSTTEFKPRLPAISATSIATTASLLMLAGIILELRHIQHLHNGKKLT